MSGLHELINNRYAKVLQEPGFRLTIEAHRQYFLQSGNYDVHVVDDHQAHKYRYDLQGYLTAVNIPNALHFTVMRLNDMTSVMDFHYDRFKALVIPLEKVFQEVVNRYKTSIGNTV